MGHFNEATVYIKIYIANHAGMNNSREELLLRHSDWLLNSLLTWRSEGRMHDRGRVDGGHHRREKFSSRTDEHLGVALRKVQSQRLSLIRIDSNAL